MATEGVIFMLTDNSRLQTKLTNFTTVRDEEQSHLSQHADHNISEAKIYFVNTRYVVQ